MCSMMGSFRCFTIVVVVCFFGRLGDVREAVFCGDIGCVILYLVGGGLCPQPYYVTPNTNLTFGIVSASGGNEVYFTNGSERGQRKYE